ncbi:hypothetical protein ACRALDRAFT_2129514 [Sodiomyces alcalophilus JCM 7366]|uniref:uncharacterized protein n=1 Tax=Sodiomyces alcalophilus JCM 7366 TaxID=591952 RepID=UPI0039B3B8DE
MADLHEVLPHFPHGQYAHLLQAFDRHELTTVDLLTMEIADVGKATQLPLLEIQKLRNAVTDALHRDLGVTGGPSDTETPRRRSLADFTAATSFVSTLDDELDRTLGGGIPTGYITEIAGESGVGKTQFLLLLLLAAQLPPPHGLGRPVLYLSTESSMPTHRLLQMLREHPRFANLPKSARPSLDAIASMDIPDLESQEHIVRFQVPVAIERHNIGLLVIDSVAANYRVEFDRSAAGAKHGSTMAARSKELVRLGTLLRDLAQRFNLAVVVANQVADRFADRFTMPPLAPPTPTPGSWHRMPQESPLASRSKALSPGAVDEELLEPTSSMAERLQFRSSMPEPLGPDDAAEPAPAALAFDHQQRWFTGWGDDPLADHGLKTPSLGLVWSTQLACRIALLKKPVYGVHRLLEDESGEAGGGVPALKSWRRWMKVVFAPHVAPTGQGLEGAVEYEVTRSGLRSVKGAGHTEGDEEEKDN